MLFIQDLSRIFCIMVELNKKNALLKYIKKQHLIDNTNFIRSWIESPLLTGAIAPSGQALARTMASYVDFQKNAPIVELGPGTGAVTNALIQAGAAEEQLVLLEYSNDFCIFLKKKYPKATIIQGDAYNIGQTLNNKIKGPAGAIVSSLPLMTKPVEKRISLLNEAHRLMESDAPFVQFTYALKAPIPKQSHLYDITCSPRIWKNLPPASVWVYRKKN